MYFIDERIQVICNQLKGLRVRRSQMIWDWQYKPGQFFRPQEADAAASAFAPFDGRTMHWYSRQIGETGDYHTISGRHYWFRCVLTVPPTWDGQSLWLRLHVQQELEKNDKNPQFLIFLDGQVLQGGDNQHREVLLRRQAVGGEEMTIDVQAYSGTRFCEFSFLGEIFTVDEAIHHLYYDLQVPLWAFARMSRESRERQTLESVLNDTINLLDLREPYSSDFYASLERAQRYIRENLYEKLCGNDEVVATCIGHTHIDVAWWWTVAQTREKVARSFSTVLRLMEEYPNYKFMSSQPVLYQFLAERYPEVFEQIRCRVAEGRWEVEGGMWLEADCNLTSGESLVRQLLHGKRFFRENFGKDSRILWLPDVFGYSGALPQIMKKAGIDYFMTTKLSWNQINPIPNDTFLWRGIDGSEVLTHFVTTPEIGQDVHKRFYTTYNGMLHPDAILGGWERYQNKEINHDILISYGYGDGGGGPSREMLEISSRLEQGLPGIPKVRQERAAVYFDELNRRVRHNRRLETWEGELYFEYHRGTYTSMGRNKRSNRKGEFLMMDLELMGVLCGDYPLAEDTRLWRDILLRNQFHDILPGSSIAAVYEVSRDEYAQLQREAGEMLHERLTRLAGSGPGVTVFNTLGFDRDDVVHLGALDAEALQDENGVSYRVQQTPDGAVAYLRGLPAKGYATFSVVRGCGKSPFVHRDDFHLETPFYFVTLDEKGRIASLVDRAYDREVVRPGQLANLLRVYEDKPMQFDNWDIDLYYTEKSWPVEDLQELRWVSDGPVCTTLALTYRFCGSTICQKIHFYAESRRIDFETTMDWTLHQHLLKAEFPVDVHTDEATFDIQFGNVTRKIHTNTSWDKARFESCAQKWMDVSEGHYGVSLLNDCKYGHSVRDGVLGLTLLKSGVDPNQNADVEAHVFTYALYPHSETWRQAGTVQESYRLNQPALVVAAGTPGQRYSFASVDCSNVILETVKGAEDGDGTVLRLYECENARTRTVLTVPPETKRAFSTNLLEKIETELPLEDGRVALTMAPYEIKTILLKD